MERVISSSICQVHRQLFSCIEYRRQFLEFAYEYFLSTWWQSISVYNGLQQFHYNVWYNSTTALPLRKEPRVLWFISEKKTADFATNWKFMALPWQKKFWSERERKHFATAAKKKKYSTTNFMCRVKWCKKRTEIAGGCRKSNAEKNYTLYYRSDS